MTYKTVPAARSEPVSVRSAVATHIRRCGSNANAATFAGPCPDTDASRPCGPARPAPIVTRFGADVPHPASTTARSDGQHRAEPTNDVRN